jgi:hypothetical protein
LFFGVVFFAELSGLILPGQAGIAGLAVGLWLPGSARRF